MIRLISLLREVIEKPKAKAILLAGAPGAGKGEVVRNLNSNRLSSLKVFNIDDEIKRLSKEQGFTLDQMNADPKDRSAFAKAMSAARTKLMGTKKYKGEISNTIENKESFILDGTSSSYNETKKL
jgi:adenylate kinase family enzyme